MSRLGDRCHQARLLEQLIMVTLKHKQSVAWFWTQLPVQFCCMGSSYEGNLSRAARLPAFHNFLSIFSAGDLLAKEAVFLHIDQFSLS